MTFRSWWLALLLAPVLTLLAVPAPAATETFMTVRDGNGTSQTLRTDSNGDGSQATHMVPEVGGAPVGSGNPLPVSASLSAFTPNGSVSTPLAVTTTSANVALPTGTTVSIANTGASTAYITLGTSNSVTSTTSGIPLPAGGAISLTPGSNTYLAAITASGTATLNIAGGTGSYAGSGGPDPTTAAGSSATVALPVQGVTGGVAVPVSGTVTAAPAVGTGGYASGSVGTSSASSGVATPTKFLDIINDSATATVAFCFGSCTAVINGGGSITLPPGWHRSWEGAFVPTDAINWIASAASTPVTVGVK